MSEAGFTVRGAAFSLFVGAPAAAAEGAAPAVGDDVEPRLRKRYERAAGDVGALLASLKDDDGLPLAPYDGAAARTVVEGTAPDKSARWRLEIAVERALADGHLDAIKRGVEQLLWPPLPAVRRVHHLSCATLCPIGRALFNEHAHLVCHCLVIETERGLVLVDTGLGTAAVARPLELCGGLFVRAFRPVLDVAQTAARQIEGLGLQVDDVRHVIVTHLDIDHVGGLADFPRAAVHVLADEHKAATEPRTLLERQRYRAALWAHDVTWQLHAVKGERWYGFPCVRDLPGLPPEILLVPLAGHSRGHCGVAVDVGGRWILHCGDAYFHKDELAPEPYAPVGAALYQRLIATDVGARRANLARLRELGRGVGDGISLFSAHDPDDLVRMREG